jgi:hypothetical protein
MTDSTVLIVTATERASPADVAILLGLCCAGVVLACYGLGWLAAWADRRWPAANRYEQEGEQ